MEKESVLILKSETKKVDIKSQQAMTKNHVYIFLLDRSSTNIFMESGIYSFTFDTAYLFHISHFALSYSLTRAFCKYNSNYYYSPTTSFLSSTLLHFLRVSSSDLIIS